MCKNFRGELQNNTKIVIFVVYFGRNALFVVGDRVKSNCLRDE